VRILGIDPGTQTTGFGVIEFDGYDYQLVDFGCIKTTKEFSLAERMNQIVADLKTLIAENKPDEICLERLYFGKNVTNGIQVAHARGAMMHEISLLGFKPSEYNPMEVKLNVCGYGKAKKDQIQRMVQMILKLDFIPSPDDAADALAIAICHANTQKLNKLVA